MYKTQKATQVSNNYSSDFNYIDLELLNNTYQEPQYQSVYGNRGNNVVASADSLNRVVNFLNQNPDSHKFAIESFSFPPSSIPFFIFSNKLVDGVYNYNRFIITFEILTENIRVSDYVFSTRDEYNVGFLVYGYETFISDMNRIFKDLFNQAKTLYDNVHGAGSWTLNTELPQYEPIVVYDESQDRFIFYADPKQADNYSVGPVIACNWWFSNNLSQLFRGNLFSDGKFSTINKNYGFSDIRKLAWEILPNNYNIGQYFYKQIYSGVVPTSYGSENLYVRNVQQCQNNGNWMKFTKLIVYTNYLRINKIQQATNLSYNTVIANTTSNVKTNSLMSYTLDSEGVYNNNNRYIYNSNYPKWMDLTDNSELRRIDLSFALEDIKGTYVNLEIPTNERVTARVLLANKLF